MRNFQKIDKNKIKVKCSRCGKFKYVRYKDNFRGTCICADCVNIQTLNVNRLFLIPRPITKEAGIKRGDKLKITINDDKTLTLKKVDDDKRKDSCG